MFIPRTLATALVESARGYPVVSLVGPRQAGKTTLARHTFPDKPYVSLEAPDIRAFALDDPRGFLSQYPDGAILDEIQRTPHLLSYLQVMVDEDGRSGLFLLTGSQHFLLMEGVTQSLAGRTAILTLLPFSLEEIGEPYGPLPTDTLIHRGFYPRIYDRGLEPHGALRNYFQTYVERDVRSLLRVHDLNTFETFVRLCAGRVGQLLNLSSLANDAGISPTTAREWLGLLETSFVTFRLSPWSSNINKRLTKTPKLYFTDPGLAAYLLGVEEERHLPTHPLRGNLFENLVVVDLLKTRLNRGRDGRLTFFRDSTGHEIDLLYPCGPDLIPIEIKAGRTINRSWFDNLEYFSRQRIDSGPPGLVVYGGNEVQHRKKGTATGLWSLPETVRDLLPGGD